MTQDRDSASHILVAVGAESQLLPLLTVACMLTRSEGGRATLLCVTHDGTCPAWLRVPPSCSDLPVTIDSRVGTDPGKVILDVARETEADLILLGWSGLPGSRRYLLGSTLDPVTRYAPCDVAVVRAEEIGEICNVLIPAAGGPNATRALALALQLSPEVYVTALNVARDSLGPLGIAAGNARLKEVLEPWRGEPRIRPKVVHAQGIVEGILTEASNGYDMLLIGATNESYIDRKLFGDVPQRIAAEAPVPTIVVRRRAGRVRSFLRQVERWFFGIQGQITASQQVQAYQEVQRGARASTDFFVLMAMAAAIAALGLLMDSPAVIIGAMIIAPLMSAIFGISMGIVQGDTHLLLRAISTTLRGVGLAIGIGALVGWIVPLGEITSEMLSRTQPTLLDLFVALVSGAAGAYAQCRRNVLGAVAGVAVAVALVPPLATAGIGLTISSGAIAGGALLSFLTNLSAITAAGSVVFLFFGYRPDPGQRIRVFGRGILGVLVLLVVVSVALSLLSIDSFRSATLQHSLRGTLDAEIGQMEGVELETFAIADGYRQDQVLRLEVEVSALRPISAQEAADLQEALSSDLGRPVDLMLSITSITQLDPGDG
jgi:uncharacterized hydrophobic protein (TIGR00271 family)